MKTSKQFLAYLTMMLLTAAALFAQEPTAYKTFSKNDVANLVNGISSENTGLKRSAVYMAGKYVVHETENALIEALKSENNEQDRILIALALYKIGSYDGYEAVKELSKYDESMKVRRITKAICDALEVERNDYFVNLN
jgi:HEAT repeat protein